MYHYPDNANIIFMDGRQSISLLGLTLNGLPILHTNDLFVNTQFTEQYRFIDNDDKNLECPVSYELIEIDDKYYKCSQCKYNINYNSVSKNLNNCPMCRFQNWNDNVIYINNRPFTTEKPPSKFKKLTNFIVSLCK
jgi:hypothetical protein